MKIQLKDMGKYVGEKVRFIDHNVETRGRLVNVTDTHFSIDNGLSPHAPRVLHFNRGTLKEDSCFMYVNVSEVDLDTLPNYRSEFRLEEKEDEEDVRYISVFFGFPDEGKVGDLSSLQVSLYKDDEHLVTNTLNESGFSDHKDVTVISTSFILGTEGNTDYAWDRGEYDGTQPNKVSIVFVRDGVTFTFTTDDIVVISREVDEDDISF